MRRITSGRVRLRCSLQPSYCAPPKSAGPRPAAWSIVPMAPSSTRMRSSSASRRRFMKAIVAHMTTLPLALDGVRVLDLSRVLAGPFCGMLLADLGADVLKVEDTTAGDESRTWPPHKDGEAAAYLVINRNKRDMTLDLKQPEGVAVLRRMVGRADVLIENFRTGTMETFGLGYD